MPQLIRLITGFKPGLRAIHILLRRTALAQQGAEENVVRDMIDDVRERGDRAIVELERKFTGTSIKSNALRVSTQEFKAARDLAGKQFLGAARRITANVRAYHKRQRRLSWTYTRKGVTLGRKFNPIDRLGIYVPAGKAPLPSTLIMTAVPAQVAGVRSIVVCTPPNRDGVVDSHILAVASTLGLKDVFKAGGAAAIAAMAFGTKTIPRVDKIVGPGNVYVVLAKKMLFGTVGIESLPGPSEVAIIADDTANAEWVAADLLAQAEHGADSVCALFTNSRSTANAVQSALRRQMATLKRAEFALKSLQEFGLIVVTSSLDECCALANELAPEHLQLMTKQPKNLMMKIRHAGAIFLGHHSPVPLGDYVAGPSHVLPTAGTARFSSGLSVDDFTKASSILSYSPSASLKARVDLEVLAGAEGLDAHARSLEVRRKG